MAVFDPVVRHWGEDRLKTLDVEKPFLRGEDASLQVDALGADFEPSMDAMVEARISGPDNYNKVVQLYPQGSNARAICWNL